MTKDKATLLARDWDRLMAMSCEELVALPFEVIERLLSLLGPDASGSGRADLKARICQQISPLVEPYVVEARRAFDTGQSDVSDLVARYEREPSVVKLFAWMRMTERPFEDVEHCRFVHKHFARGLLEAFHVSVDPEVKP